MLLAVLPSLLNAVTMFSINDEPRPITTTGDAGEAILNSGAHVMCYFPPDIRQSLYMVTVKHFPHEFASEKETWKPSAETDVHIICSKNITDEPNYHIHDDYSLNYYIRDELTATIPSVILHHPGIYLCQVKIQQAPPKDDTLLVKLTGCESVQQEGSMLTILAVILASTFSNQTITIAVFLCVYRPKPRSRHNNTSTNDYKAVEAEASIWLKNLSEDGSTDSGDKSLTSSQESRGL